MSSFIQKRSVSVILFLLIFQFVLTPIVHGSAKNHSKSNYKDVPPSHWAYKEIMWAKENHIVSGYNDQSFKPREAITEAQLLAMVVRFMGLNAGGNQTSQHWADRIYELANNYHFPINGYENLRIRNAPITRGHFAKIIAYTQGEEATYQAGIDWLYQYQITTGAKFNHPNKYIKFNIDGQLTRAEAAVFFYRLHRAGFYQLTINPNLSSVDHSQERYSRKVAEAEMLFSIEETKTVLMNEMQKRGYQYRGTTIPSDTDPNYTTIHTFEKGNKLVMLIQSLNGAVTYWTNFSETDHDIVPITTILFNQIDGLYVLSSDLQAEMNQFIHQSTSNYSVPELQFYNTNLSIQRLPDQQLFIEITRKNK